MMFYILRSQLFYDGNKCTAQIVANQIMIQNDCGIIAIPVEKQQKFCELLIDYYESGDNNKCMQFVYNNALDGFTLQLRNTRKREEKLER